jgi:hypothetical protein
MTTHIASTTPSIGRRRRDLISAPAVAGIGYTAAWVVGLVVWPSNLDVSASNAEVVATYNAHRGAAMTQYLLVEGLAAIALTVVVISLGREARARGAETLARATVVAGVAAAAISLLQCAVGLVLAGFLAPDGETRWAGRVFDLINRWDGVKMVALAAMAAAGVGLSRRAVLPRWLGYVAVSLVAALLVSGAGYLLLSETPAQAVLVAGPLLLVWVTGAGVAVGLSSTVRSAQDVTVRRGSPARWM